MTTTSRRMPCSGSSLTTVQGYAAFQVGTQQTPFRVRTSGLRWASINMAAQPPMPQPPSRDPGSADGDLPFKCEVVPDGDSVAIRLFGELDIATAPEVDAAFADVAERGVPITLDLRGLRFMDSRGIRMLVSCHDQALAEGFPLTVACGDGVGELLKMTGLDRHLTLAE